MPKRIELKPSNWVDKYKDFISPSLQVEMINSIAKDIAKQKDDIIKARFIGFGIVTPWATQQDFEDAARKCTLEIYPDYEKMYYSNGSARVRIIFIDKRIDLNMDWLADSKTNSYTVTGWSYL